MLTGGQLSLLCAKGRGSRMPMDGTLGAEHLGKAIRVHSAHGEFKDNNKPSGNPSAFLSNHVPATLSHVTDKILLDLKRF